MCIKSWIIFVITQVYTHLCLLCVTQGLFIVYSLALLFRSYDLAFGCVLKLRLPSTHLHCLFLQYYLVDTKPKSNDTFYVFHCFHYVFKMYIHWHCSLGYFTYLKAIKSRKMLSRSSTYIDFRTYNTVKSSILFTYFHRNISYNLLLIPQNIYIQWLRYLGYFISSNWDIYQNGLRLHWKYLRSDKSNNICFTFKSEITKTAINSTNIYHISKLAHSATQYFVCIILHIINTKISTTLTQVKQYLTHIKSRISNDCVIYV